MLHVAVSGHHNLQPACGASLIRCEAQESPSALARGPSADNNDRRGGSVRDRPCRRGPCPMPETFRGTSSRPPSPTRPRCLPARTVGRSPKRIVSGRVIPFSARRRRSTFSAGSSGSSSAPSPVGSLKSVTSSPITAFSPIFWWASPGLSSARGLRNLPTSPSTAFWLHLIDQPKFWRHTVAVDLGRPAQSPLLFGLHMVRSAQAARRSTRSDPCRSSPLVDLRIESRLGSRRTPSHKPIAVGSWTDPIPEQAIGRRSRSFSTRTPAGRATGLRFAPLGDSASS